MGLCRWAVVVLAGLIMLKTSAAQNSTICYAGAYILVARESDAEPGYGYLGAVKDGIVSRIPNSGSIAVTYPATIAGPPLYNVSEAEGVGNLTELVRAYGDACPDNKMILMGYSQGAHVVGDTLIGAYYPNFPQLENKTGIEQKYIDQVVAVIMMGDPANVAGQPFLVGNSTKNGTFPRFNAANWATANLVDKIQSYCDADDVFCDLGTSEAVHNGYIPEYGVRAADFAVSRFNGNNTASNSTTGTSATISSTTSTVSTTATSNSASTTSSTSRSGTSLASSPTSTPNGAIVLRSTYLDNMSASLLQGVLAILLMITF